MVICIYLSIVPFCQQCYAKIHKKTWFTIAHRVPINHGFAARLAYLIVVYMIGVVTPFMLRAHPMIREAGAVGELWWVYALVWGPLVLGVVGAAVIRWISYVRYERPLIKEG